jgi:hypothetical protein
MWLQTKRITNMKSEPANPDIAAPTMVALAAPNKYTIDETIGTLTRYSMNPNAYPKSQNPNIIGPRPI